LASVAASIYTCKVTKIVMFDNIRIKKK
jgi:hypothetical protein